MNAIVRLPSTDSLTETASRLVDAEREAVCESVPMTHCTITLRRLAGDLERRPEDEQVQAAVKRQIARWRFTEPAYSVALAQSNARRREMVEALCRAVGECVVCGLAATNGTCPDCVDVLQGDVL